LTVPLTSAARTQPAFCFHSYRDPRGPHSFPTRRSSDLPGGAQHRPRDARRRIREREDGEPAGGPVLQPPQRLDAEEDEVRLVLRSEEHTSELQSRENLVCRLLLEKKKITQPQSRCRLTA